MLAFPVGGLPAVHEPRKTGAALIAADPSFVRLPSKDLEMPSRLAERFLSSGSRDIEQDQTPIAFPAGRAFRLLFAAKNVVIDNDGFRRGTSSRLWGERSMGICVLYHKDADGFGAAWAIRHHFQQPQFESLRSSIRYLPVQYGQPFPSAEVASEDEIYILDFSYPRDLLVEFSRNHTLLVIEHHRSVEQELQGLSFVHYDANRSAAVIAWEYFHPKEPLPVFLSYIQDSDLRRAELRDSKEVNATIASYPFNFELWDLKIANRSLEELAAEGTAILCYIDRLVEKSCNNVVFGEVGGYDVPVVNASLLSPEVCNLLCKKYPEYPFVAAYSHLPEGKRWLLKSQGEFDVAKVAKKLGGGGQRNVAGSDGL
jgi:hypothetical protein